MTQLNSTENIAIAIDFEMLIILFLYLIQNYGLGNDTYKRSDRNKAFMKTDGKHLTVVIF